MEKTDNSDQQKERIKRKMFLPSMFILAIGIISFFYSIIGYIMGLDSRIITFNGQELPLVTAKVFRISLCMALISYVSAYMLIRHSRNIEKQDSSC